MTTNEDRSGKSTQAATRDSRDVEITERAGRGALAIFGAGYVGGALARRALAAGRRVVALTRNPETAAGLRALGCAVIEGELASEAWWSAPELEGEVARVAVTVAGGGRGPEGYRRSYVEGLRGVLGWGRRRLAGGAPIGHLIYTGSTTVYPQDGGVRVTEADATGGEGEMTRALLEAEALAGEWPGRATILRLAGIYGPTRTHLVEQVRSGEVAGRAEAHLNLVHRDDIVAAMEAAWDRGGAGGGAEVFNLADAGEATKGEVVAWLAARLGVPEPVFTGRPAGGRRAVTPDRIIDASRARAELGWRPVFPTFREGYSQVLAVADAGGGRGRAG